MTEAWQLAFDAAKKAWPTVTVAPNVFATAYAAASEGEDDAIHASDLYWALGCLGHQNAALEALKKALTRLLSGKNMPTTERDDLVGQAVASLVMGRTGSPPKLTQYRGRSPLGGWLHVVVSRLFLNSKRGVKEQTDLDDQVVLGASDVALPPELELAREKYRGVFSASFRAGIAALTPRQRNLLRQHYLDGLSLDQVAALYRVHRATAARWLQQARAEVLDKMREDVAKKTGLGRSEVDSMMKLVRSRMELSASVFLSAPGASPGEPS